MNEEYIAERATKLGHYIVNNESTVRDAAEYHGVSKSTVHKDVSDRLQDINILLYEEVRDVLDKNKKFQARSK